MSEQRVGTCSLCGGDVVGIRGAWWSVSPPPPDRCAQCGAVREEEVIPMRPAPPTRRAQITTTDNSVFAPEIPVTDPNATRCAEWCRRATKCAPNEGCHAEDEFGNRRPAPSEAVPSDTSGITDAEGIFAYLAKEKAKAEAVTPSGERESETAVIDALLESRISHDFGCASQNPRHRDDETPTCTCNRRELVAIWRKLRALATPPDAPSAPARAGETTFNPLTATAEELRRWFVGSSVPLADNTHRFAELRDLIVSRALAPATAEPTAEAVEESAKLVYAAMQKFDNPNGQKYPWVERGNSLAQDEARRTARAILASRGSGPVGQASEALTEVLAQVNALRAENVNTIQASEGLVWFVRLNEVRDILTAHSAVAASAEAKRGERIEGARDFADSLTDAYGKDVAGTTIGGDAVLWSHFKAWKEGQLRAALSPERGG